MAAILIYGSKLYQTVIVMSESESSGLIQWKSVFIADCALVQKLIFFKDIAGGHLGYLGINGLLALN